MAAHLQSATCRPLPGGRGGRARDLRTRARQENVDQQISRVMQPLALPRLLARGHARPHPQSATSAPPQPAPPPRPPLSAMHASSPRFLQLQLYTEQGGATRTGRHITELRGRTAMAAQAWRSGRGSGARERPHLMKSTCIAPEAPALRFCSPRSRAFLSPRRRRARATTSITMTPMTRQTSTWSSGVCAQVAC